MKRNKMQRILAGFLSTIYETDKHPEKQLERAGEILTMLEGQGMKPPVSKRCPVLLTEIHTWESESEQNTGT